MSTTRRGWEGLIWRDDEPPALRFTVPLPPSTNNLYDNIPRHGRVKSGAYRAWLTDAGWTVKAQMVQPLPPLGRVRVLIEAPVSRRRDVDNCAKGPLDLMVKLGLIGDDRLVDDLRIVRTKGGEMVVSVWPITADVPCAICGDPVPAESRKEFGFAAHGSCVQENSRQS